MNIADTIVGWQCIGVCQDRKVELVALGPLPSLHELRWRSPALVRPLHRYYAGV
jgi:hypothetical protein